MLSCDQLSIELGHKNIFDRLGFTLMPGSVLLVKGPNGSGKTSLLKTIAGLISLTSGTIYWQNQDITVNPYEFKRNINYIGHKNAVKGQLSVIQNIEFWAKLYNAPELIWPALACFNLIEKSDIPCKLLSAGWQRRVALAKLVSCQSRIWLLDEPETGLDQEGRELLLNLIKIKIANGGIAIIATHSLYEIPGAQILAMQDFVFREQSVL